MNGEQDQPSMMLARQIEEAFAEVAYPGDDHLVEGGSSEAAELAEVLRGRRWQDLGLGELLRNCQGLFFMTPGAIRFYLPAYLLVSLSHYEKADAIPGAVMFLLKPPVTNDSAGRLRFQARFGPLTQQQRAAIKSFLEYIRDEHSEDFVQAKDAIDLLQWWGSADAVPQITVRRTLRHHKGAHSLLTTFGAVFTTLGAVGLGLTLRFFGLDPSRWFIIAGGGAGREVSGWIITTFFGLAILAGLTFLVLGHHQKARGPHI